MKYCFIEYKVNGENFAKLYKIIKDNGVQVYNVVEKNKELTFRTTIGCSKSFVYECEQAGYEVKQTRKGDFLTLAKRITGRPALIIFGVIVIAAIIFMNNIVMRFDIKSDDEKIKEGIMNVLKEEGVTAGSYIPDISLIETERALKQRVDGICWAGITRKGNTLIIDIIETIPKKEGYKRRLPSDIIAKENGVIEKIDMLDGQLLLGVGCGVTKGDKIISGEIVTTKSTWIDGKENIDVKTKYARSIGTAYGSFDRTVTFTQKLNDSKKVPTGNKSSKHYFHIFSADIPLFFGSIEGRNKSETKLDNLKLFSLEMPFGIKTTELTEYDFKPVIYTKKEAKKLNQSKIKSYEKNFLGDYEIKNKTVNYEQTDQYVKTTVTYSLYGIMSEEVSFFIKK